MRNVDDTSLLLAIETSCDETAAAIVTAGGEMRSNVVWSQIVAHERFGGVVPEIASRLHVEHITIVIDEAMRAAGVGQEDIGAVAVTQGPGLVGALFVGIMAAKSIAYARGVPLIGVHHIAGHVYAQALCGALAFPLLAVVVSGGHTELMIMREHLCFETIGRSRDDAVGEAYDKVARALRLPYPGGPHIEKLAAESDTEIVLPRAWLDGDDFSFSGVKSAVMAHIHRARMRGDVINAPALARGFQQSVIDVLCTKAMRAACDHGIPHIVLCGGVAANGALRKALQQAGDACGVSVCVPPRALCTDNAAMIGACGAAMWRAGRIADMHMEAKSLWNIDTFGGVG
jgi:N6-L-threonylcarbamoyladenine synthase